MRPIAIFCFFLATTLSLSAQTACIEGRVVDTSDAPIPYIQIIGIGPRGSKFLTGTDKDGHFRIANLPAGDYGIATGEEFRADFDKIRFNGVADVKNIPLVTVKAIVDNCSSVSLRRPERAHIHLLAKDVLTTEDVSTAKAVFRYNAQTSWNRDRSKEQDLIVPPLMEIQLQAGASGYEDSPIMTIPALQPGEMHELPLSLRPLQKGCISGQVVDHLGAPASGVSVQPDLVDDLMDRRVGSKATDKSGRFRFEGVQPGKYWISPTAMQLGYPWIPGHDNDVFITVEPSAGCKDLTINLGPKGATIELKVVDAQTHQPLMGSVVFFSGLLSNGITWVRRFDAPPILVPALKPLKVYAERNGYRASKEVGVGPLQPEETRQLTIELYPLASGEVKSQR